MSEKTVAEVQRLVAKWAPPSKSKEFIADMGGLIQIATCEQFEHVFADMKTGVYQAARTAAGGETA